MFYRNISYFQANALNRLIISNKSETQNSWNKKSKAVPHFASKFLTHRGTDTYVDKTVGWKPIADGDQGEANENEGDAHDENNNKEDGVRVFLSHVLLGASLLVPPGPVLLR